MSIPLPTPAPADPDLRTRIWTELQLATQDRHHAWRLPVLATVGADGLPQARTVVLRQADAALGQLQIYTDARSPKVAALVHTPQAVLVFWSKPLRWQLRVQVVISVQSAGPEVDALWAEVRQTAAAHDYLCAQAPGDALRSDDQATAMKREQAPHHLAILRAQVQEIDWLELASSEHRRAVFSADAWEWRVP